EARLLHLAPDRDPLDAAALPLRPAHAARLAGPPSARARQRGGVGAGHRARGAGRVSPLLFLLLAALTVASALTVVVHRDPVRRGAGGRRPAGGVRRDGRARPAALHRLPPALRAHLDPPPGRYRGCGGARQEVAMTPPLAWYLGLSAVLFAIGVLGVLIRRNVIVIFMAIELMLNAVNLSFVALARSSGSMDGQVIVFFVMTVAAAEAAVGLAIILSMFRNRETTNVDELATLRW